MAGHHNPQRGFTLIELLVVIAIMSIILAITLPMIPGLNDQARIATCESRLEQLGIALRLYAEDHQRLPRRLDDLYAGRYIESRRILRCDKAETEYYYRPLPLNAPRGQVLLACCAPATPSGKRPHRYGTMAVQLPVGGPAALAR